VELMLVLTLLGVTASLALPELGRQLSRWQMQAVAERLSHDLAEARFAAVQKRSPQYLRVQSGDAGGGAWCWSVSELPNCPCDTEQYCQRQRVVAPKRGGVDLPTNTVFRFEPTADLRTLPSAPTEIVSRHGERLQVHLTPLGRARICSVETARMGYGVC
jgi:type IV fimbrial biogenesis protein FimT